MKKSALVGVMFMMMGAGMAHAQEGRPPIALPSAPLQQNMPAPTYQPQNTPAPTRGLDADLTELDMQSAVLSMSRAIAQSGCLVTTQNRANILSLTGLSSEEAADTISLMAQSGAIVRAPDNQSLRLASCTPPSATQAAPAQPAAPAASVEPAREPLTLLQRRRCADMPSLPFCG